MVENSWVAPSNNSYLILKMMFKNNINTTLIIKNTNKITNSKILKLTTKVKAGNFLNK